MQVLAWFDQGAGAVRVTILDAPFTRGCKCLAIGTIPGRGTAPYVLAGRAGGRLAHGRFLSFEGDVPHNNLLVSILNAVGIPDATFGNTDWCTGALPGLV